MSMHWGRIFFFFFFCGISSSPATTDTSRCWPCGHQGWGLERAEPFKESCMNWLVKWDSLEAVIILNVDQLIGKYTVLQDYNAAVGLWWFMAVTIADVSGLEWTDWLSCHLSFSMLKFGHDRQVLCHWATSSFPLDFSFETSISYCPVEGWYTCHSSCVEVRAQPCGVGCLLPYQCGIWWSNSCHRALETSASICQTQLSFLYLPL